MQPVVEKGARTASIILSPSWQALSAPYIYSNLLLSVKDDAGSDQELFPLDVQQFLGQESQLGFGLLAPAKPAVHQVERSTDVGRRHRAIAACSHCGHEYCS